MSYDVPGGGKKGSNYVNKSDWTAPFSGRLLVAASHNHGGAKYQTLESRTCGRRLFKAVRNDLRDREMPRLLVWALADNERACRFYGGLGGRTVARVEERIGGVPLVKLAYLFR